MQIIITYQKASETDKIKVSGAFLLSVGIIVSYRKLSYLNGKVVHKTVRKLYIKNHVQSRVFLKIQEISNQIHRKKCRWPIVM